MTIAKVGVTRVQGRIAAWTAVFCAAVLLSGDCGVAHGAESYQLPPAVGRILGPLLPQTDVHVVGTVGPISFRPRPAVKDVQGRSRRFTGTSRTPRPRPGWWLAATDVAVELVPGASKGLAIVSLSSNGRTWGQIEIRRLSGGRVSWNTVDIVRGYSAEFVHTKRFVVPVANFPSLRAIHPGTNTLRLSVQQAGGLRIARVSAPRSVFLATPLIPQPLEIGASVGNLGTLSVGDTVDVPYLVRNKNPTPLSTVHLETTNTHGVVAGVSNRLIDTLTKTQHGVVTVKLLREGEATFDLVAYTESARDAVRVELDVDAASPDPQSHGNTLYWGVATAVGVLIALECIWLIARMIRRRVS